MPAAVGNGANRGSKGGITGGAIFPIWMEDCEIANNRFTRTRQERQHEFYGIKCRQGKRCHVHHNTIEVNFSIEFPFENDEDIEIDHNICHGTISLPKHARAGRSPKAARHFICTTTGCAILTRSSSSVTASKSTTTFLISIRPRIRAI